MNTVQRILVTGGAGFVGSELVRQLVDEIEAPRIAVLDNLRNGRRAHVPASPRVTLHVADLTQPDEVRRVVAEVRPDWLFHLGALHFIPYCNAHPAETLHVNVVGSQHLLDACAEHPPTAFILASTAAVYPIMEGPCSEETPVGAVDIYGLSKWTNEQQLALFAQRSPSHCSAARLFNVFGPRETNPHVIPEILQQLTNGQEEIQVGNLSPRRDYIHVSDVARGLRMLAEKNTHSYRTYNVGSGREYSVQDILDELGRIAGRPLRPAVRSERVRRIDRQHLVADISRMEVEIGWLPRYDLARGLAELWQSESTHALAEAPGARP
jgi:UDP-glucose 4-epimerase